jgi:hypothetical protein
VHEKRIAGVSRSGVLQQALRIHLAAAKIRVRSDRQTRVAGDALVTRPGGHTNMKARTGSSPCHECCRQSERARATTGLNCRDVQRPTIALERTEYQFPHLVHELAMTTERQVRLAGFHVDEPLLGRLHGAHHAGAARRITVHTDTQVDTVRSRIRLKPRHDAVQRILRWTNKRTEH